MGAPPRWRLSWDIVRRREISDTDTVTPIFIRIIHRKMNTFVSIRVVLFYFICFVYFVLYQSFFSQFLFSNIILN